jgi:osmoprotectant transport system ATP-binding protein
LDVQRGAFAVIVGPSGCGKTTLLKTVNRLLEPTGGRVFVDGVDVTSVDAVLLRRRIGYAIQQVGLLPHMTVAQNVAVVPTLLGWSRERVRDRVDELLSLVHLDEKEFASRYPRQLSGGQQQRVGLARALAGDPAVLLMDEPFGAVDAIERTHLQDEISGLQRRLAKTILFVTHDVDEALRLGDQIVVMQKGKVEQAGSPFAVLAQPKSSFVAELFDTHDVLRRLSVLKVGSAMDSAPAATPPVSSERSSGLDISPHSTLREALSQMTADGERSMRVAEGGSIVGTLTLDGLLAAARQMSADQNRR